MEPFGLFHFLRNTLFSEPPTSPEKGKDNEESSTLSPQKDEPNPPSALQDPAEQNACLLFLDAHDRRSKRLKK